ncbi:hypothetical protein B0H11DRAFT_2225623 [Mycena galericulata]|nr:hypothetical protein B0H11DRAFT_2225623 [Mycena galericulata]
MSNLPALQSLKLSSVSCSAGPDDCQLQAFSSSPGEARSPSDLPKQTSSTLPRLVPGPAPNPQFPVAGETPLNRSIPELLLTALGVFSQGMSNGTGDLIQVKCRRSNPVRTTPGAIATTGGWCVQAPVFGAAGQTDSVAGIAKPTDAVTIDYQVLL